MSAAAFVSWLKEQPPSDEPWVERQRRFWEEALDRLEAILRKRKPERETS